MNQKYRNKKIRARLERTALHLDPDLDLDPLMSRKLATRPSYVTPAHESYDELEELYWTELINDKSDPPIYGADVCDSVTDPVDLIDCLND